MAGGRVVLAGSLWGLSVTTTQPAKPHARCVILTPVEEACGYVETLTRLAGRKRRLCTSAPPAPVIHTSAHTGAPVLGSGGRAQGTMQRFTTVVPSLLARVAPAASPLKFHSPAMRLGRRAAVRCETSCF